MAGQDADDTVAGANDSLSSEVFQAGDAGGRCGLAAEAAGSDLCFGVKNLLIGDGADDAIGQLHCSQCLKEIDRAIDLNGAGERRGFADGCVVFVDDVVLDRAAVPAQAVFIKQLIKRVGPDSVNDSEAWNPLDEAE